MRTSQPNFFDLGTLLVEAKKARDDAQSLIEKLTIAIERAENLSPQYKSLPSELRLIKELPVLKPANTL